MSATPPQSSTSRVGSYFIVAALAAAALVAAELAARVDDWFFDSVPPLSSPSFEDLFTKRADGIRVGVPDAKWKSVQLNQLGLRGPDVVQPKRADCQRWLFLGASETFGEPSVLDGDYPSTIRRELPSTRCIEVLNGSFPGLDLPAMARWYDVVLSGLDADVVLVLAPTHLYLGNKAPAEAQKPSPTERVGREEETLIDQLRKLVNNSRLVERIKDSAEVPAPLQRRRTQRWVADQLTLHPSNWPFDTVPTDRLDMLQEDLSTLVRVIRSHGAEPVAITHPVRSSSPPRPEDHADLFAMRAYVPRAPEFVIAKFEYEAAERTRLVGEVMGIRIVDAAKAMSGQRDLFIDLVHYSDKGRDAISSLVVSELLQTRQEPNGAVQ